MNHNSHFSYEDVLEDNKHKIYRICRMYAVTPVEPQDLFQEVAYQIWKSFPNFKKQSSISTWVYRIALNVCLRSKLKLEKNSLKTIRYESIQFMASEASTNQQDDERYELLKSCIDTLQEVDKSIVVLYLDEVSYKEIAGITGLSENHVAVKMKRIRKKLLDCLTPKLI